MNFMLLSGVWLAMAAAVLALVAYRKMVAVHEDDMVHLRDDEAKLVTQQTAVAHRLEMIDRWGKMLTLVTALFGAAIAALYLYEVWVSSTRLQP
ncbi:MAG: hypothetical protein K2X35_18970 [Bryobacteraceae bacterium]|nr:hypothetical protein [Bryobacteraceae bacterium]